MSGAETLDVIRRVMLSFLDIDEARIHPGAELASFGLASLDWVEIQIELEMKYGVRVDPDLIAKGRIRTVADLIQHVERLRAAQAEGGA